MYDRLAALPLCVESVGFDRRERDTSSGFTRATTVVSLSGDHATGKGEDVTYETEEHDPQRWADLNLSLGGEYTLESFSALLDERDLFPIPPDREYAPEQGGERRSTDRRPRSPPPRDSARSRVQTRSDTRVVGVARRGTRGDRRRSDAGSERPLRGDGRRDAPPTPTSTSDS